MAKDKPAWTGPFTKEEFLERAADHEKAATIGLAVGPNIAYVRTFQACALGLRLAADILPGRVKFNINHYVRVKLTPEGRVIHQKLYEPFCHPPATYVPPAEDADGWSRWQLWDLMSTFGPHVSLGLRTPFDTEIEFELPKENR